MYAGGFTQGVKRYFDTKEVWQDDSYGFKTFHLNFPNAPLRTFSVDDIADAPRADLLYANPPCAIFSMSSAKAGGGRADWRTDQRAGCWTRTISLVDAVKPKIVAIESVQGALTRGLEFIQSLTDQMSEKGYSVTWVKVNANKHGVAQNRPRFFFVAHKVAIPWMKPTAKAVVVSDVLRDLDNMTGPEDKKRRLKSWYRRIPQGAVAIKVWNDENDLEDAKRDYLGRVVGRPAFTIRRINLAKRAPVLLHNAIHPTQNRYVNVSESKAIMGFPQTFKTVETGSSAVVLLTRGVCPPVGTWLARQFDNALDAGVKRPVTFDMVDFS
jgi:site-specific DNA-cytosine methylase